MTMMINTNLLMNHYPIFTNLSVPHIQLKYLLDINRMYPYHFISKGESK